MSLRGNDEAFFPKLQLRTSDQYTLWKERVAACCWASTRLEVFSLTDGECEAINHEYEEKKGDAKERTQGWQMLGHNNFTVSG